MKTDAYWGPALDTLGQRVVTPLAALFVRHHGSVPKIDLAAFVLRVGGLVNTPLALTLDTLRRELDQVEIVATLQCAGNRRRELSAVGDLSGEIPWGAEAIGTAVWRGVRLSEVCARAGVAPGAAHVVFEGYDDYVVSIPLAKALAAETILVYAVNGTPLPVVHGAPLRVIVPGYIGARSVKWLRRIELASEPSEGHYQRHAYRTDDGALNGLPVTSAICSPLHGSVVTDWPVRVSGYAVASEGACIARVEVTADGGAHWQAAELGANPSVWAWRLWAITLDLRPGTHTLAARATDSTGATQPAELSSVWNARGYLNNAWHRVTVLVTW